MDSLLKNVTAFNHTDNCCEKVQMDSLLKNAATFSAPPISEDTRNTIRYLSAAIERLAHHKCILIVDTDTSEVLYRSERLIYMDEVLETDKERDFKKNPYWEYACEEHMDFIRSVKEHIPNLAQMMTTEEFSRHVSITEFAIRVKNKLVYIHQELTPVLMRTNGMTKIGILSYGMAVQPRGKKCEARNTVFVRSEQSIRRWRFDERNNTYVEEQKISFTPTEEKLIVCMKRGMMNKEIADTMNIKENTVKVHKAKIFHKLGVATQDDAISMIENFHV